MMSHTLANRARASAAFGRAWALHLGDDTGDRDPDRLAGAADLELVVALEELADGRGLHEAVGAGDEDAAAPGDLVADLAGDNAAADGGQADAVDDAALLERGGVGANADAHHARDRRMHTGLGD